MRFCGMQGCEVYVLWEYTMYFTFIELAEAEFCVTETALAHQRPLVKSIKKSKAHNPSGWPIMSKLRFDLLYIPLKK